MLRARYVIPIHCNTWNLSYNYNISVVHLCYCSCINISLLYMVTGCLICCVLSVSVMQAGVTYLISPTSFANYTARKWRQEQKNHDLAPEPERGVSATPAADVAMIVSNRRIYIQGRAATQRPLIYIGPAP